MKRHALALMLAPVVIPALTGAGASASTIRPVSGTLTFKRTPRPQVYLRIEPDDMTTKSTSMAVTEADGKFKMMIGSTPGVFRGQVKVYCDHPLAAMGTK